MSVHVNRSTKQKSPWPEGWPRALVVWLGGNASGEAGEEGLREGAEGEGTVGEWGEGVEGGLGVGLGEVADALRAEEAEGVEAVAGVGLGGVEEVVDELEGEADLAAVVGEGRLHRGGGVGGDGAEETGKADEGGGLEGIDAVERGFVPGLGRLLGGGEVGDLPIDDQSGGLGEGAEQGGGAAAPGQLAEGHGLEAVADEDGQILAELGPDGGLAAPLGVVVHRGEVVVNEGVAVEELDGDRGAEGVRTEARLPAAGLGAEEGEAGADALAAAHDGMGEGLVEG